MLTDQLELDDDPIAPWSAERGPAMNLERYLQQKALKPFETPLLWGLDHVDRLFPTPFGSETFALFRSWHNRRALDPAGLWSRLTLALTYATEAHLFITDPNQSPFNVGTRLALDDFTPEQAADLNGRYRSPLGDTTTEARFFALAGGQPFLVQRGLDAMARAEAETPGAAARLLATLERGARDDNPLFGDHLRRMRRSLMEDANLTDVVRALLRGEPCPTLNDLYRLRSAGILAGDAPKPPISAAASTAITWRNICPNLRRKEKSGRLDDRTRRRAALLYHRRDDAAGCAVVCRASGGQRPL